MKKTGYSIFFFLLFFALKSKAGFDFNEQCQNAFSLVAELRWVEAKNILEAERKQNKTNVAVVYIENYIDCLKLILNEEKADMDLLKANKNIRLQIIEQNLNKNNPYYRFIKAEILLQWAYSRIKFNDYTDAALEINKAYRLLVENEKLYPEFYLNKKSLGFLHALIGTIPDDYQWAVSLMGFKGDVNQGANELKQVYYQCKSDSVNKLYCTEIIISRCFVESNLRNDKKELTILLEEINTLKSSPLLVFSKASAYIKLGENDKAIEVLKTKFSKNYIDFQYLNYLLGDCKLRRLDKDADIYLKKYLLNFKGFNYIKACNLRLWWYALLYNQESDKNKVAVLKTGSSIVDEDKQAVKEVEQNRIPSLPLLKARLLFDGGYYDKAFDELKQIEKKDLQINENYIEYCYRVARILDKTDKKENAKQFYEIALKTGENTPLYYAASSALCLGNIYEEEGDFKKAEIYYKKCINLKNHAYKTSLSQKAKAGINRIKSKK